ncbi:MAG: hypothetical protein QXT74_02695 [Candidatus Nezhaarchaeales archaeon]
MSSVEDSLSDVERRILSFLRSRQRGATASFIATKVGKSLELVYPALKRLLLLNIIERRGKFFRARGKRAAKLNRAEAS